MPLKTIETTVVPAQKKAAKSKVPEVRVSGHRITEFAKAKHAEKEAKATVAELEPEIRRIAVAKYLSSRCGSAPIDSSSIKLEDDYGSVVRFDFKDQYKVADPVAVEALFEAEFAKDCNDYVQEVMEVKFDNSVFLDAKGEFSQDRFNRFNAAIAAAAAALQVPNPLSSVRKVVPKINFHARRFVDFDKEENSRIFETLPNTVAFSVLEVGSADAIATPEGVEGIEVVVLSGEEE